MNPIADIARIDRRRRLAGLLASFHAAWVKARHMTWLRWVLENT